MTRTRSHLPGQAVLEALGLGHLKHVRKLTLDFSPDNHFLGVLTIEQFVMTNGTPDVRDGELVSLLTRYRLTPLDTPTHATHPPIEEPMNAPEAAAATPSTLLTLPELRDGETYVGAIVSACGTHSHHVMVLPGDHDDATWQDAMTWAAEQGGDLPNRVEQALLFATLKDQFKKDWYWLNTPYASDARFAWCQDFNFGHQGYGNVDDHCRARAVRRLPIQSFTHLS